jgi:hypothetical protein
MSVYLSSLCDSEEGQKVKIGENGSKTESGSLVLDDHIMKIRDL